MRRVDHTDFYVPPERTVAGPLFDAGPFDHSPLGEPSATHEKVVAALIFAHQGRNNPISISRICANSDLSEREVKSVVSALRNDHHMPIGARRGSTASQEETAGYFWIVDAEDREVAVAPYRAQILTMWTTLRRMDSPAKLRDLRERLTIEEPDR
ncbi:MAG TPA: hypothetical protein VHZ25_17910 [Acidobacteriaceae bacterium]|jgi:hypothetical protein|nr:hypothetical protein [Acidobacteriaceae bacterium]